MAKVYIKLDSNNIIIEINSDIFLTNTNGYTKIDEGDGDKYAHAQNNYLEHGLTDGKGAYNYKYENDEIVELTEDEKNMMFPIIQPQPTELEILKEQQERTDQALQDLIIATLGG